VKIALRTPSRAITDSGTEGARGSTRVMMRNASVPAMVAPASRKTSWIPTNRQRLVVSRNTRCVAWRSRSKSGRVIRKVAVYDSLHEKSKRIR
jgi:hypothetical protein